MMENDRGEFLLGATAKTVTNVPIRDATGRFYRPELDALRFIAFLMVYLCHTLPVEPTSAHWLRSISYSLSFGVPVFFALSAYLITQLLLMEKRRDGSVRVQAFYLRRILRIWPLYFPVLGCGYAILRRHMPFPLTALAAYVFFVGNWYTAFFDYLPGPLLPLWSITVEEQFYLVWPAILRNAGRRRLFLVCFSMWVISQVVVIALCLQHTFIEPTLWANSLTHLQYLALGASVSIYFNGDVPRFRKSARIAMFAMAVLLFVAPGVIFMPHLYLEPKSDLNTWVWLLSAGAATTLLLLAFLGSNSEGIWSPFRYLGKISYGLYVFHMPCLLGLAIISARLHLRQSVLAAPILGLPITIAIAAASYRFFESPFLRIKERYEIVKSRTV
jgi:peptidoglycan/LPS O-acetylase OafA/YrhL